MVIIPNLSWARDPYNAEPRDLDCSRDIATERAKGQRPEDAIVSASRVHGSGSTCSFRTGADCYQLDLLCRPELQPFVLGRIWIVFPCHVEAPSQSFRGDPRRAPCHSFCKHAKQINV